MSKKIPACTVMAAILIFWASPATAVPDAVRLIPPPIGLPAPALFMKILQVITFFVHLVLVNILLGSVILAVIDPKTAAPDQKDGIAFMPKILALAVNFAIAPFLFIQVVYGSFIYPSIVLMAVWWMSVFMLVMLAYYGLYAGGDVRKPSLRKIGLIIVACLLLLTAFILVNVNTLLERPPQWFMWFSDPYGTILAVKDATVLPRYAHAVVASLAAGGLTMAWRARWAGRRSSGDATAEEIRVRRGLAWFFYASLAQLPVGLLYLFTLPREIRTLFIGGHALLTAIMAFSLVLYVFALVSARRGMLKGTTLSFLGVVFVMICLRQVARDAMLSPFVEAVTPATSQIIMPHGQYAVIALFLICTAVGIASIFWMARVTLPALRAEPAPQKAEE